MLHHCGYTYIFCSKNRSIARNASAARVGQVWQSCGLLEADPESAICEAGSTDDYDRPPFSLFTNYLQRPICLHEPGNLTPGLAGTRGRRMRLNNITGYSKAYQRALAALTPNRSAPFQDYSGVRRFSQSECLTQSTSSVVYGLASAPATLQNRLRYP